MDSFLTQMQVEELEMNEPIYYDIRTEEYITESDLLDEYDAYIELFKEYITFPQFVNNCLTINGGTLERVGC